MNGGANNSPPVTIHLPPFMPLLAIDTATRHCGLALIDARGLVCELNWLSTDGQTRELLPRLQQMLAWHGLAPTAIQAVGVGLGPGSYSSLRVGLSAAKGLALAGGLPLLGIGTLDAAAAPHLGQSEVICAVVQAGRGRVFWALYDGPEQPGSALISLGRWRGWRSAIHQGSFAELAQAIPPGGRCVGEVTTELMDALLAINPAIAPAFAGAASRRAAALAELAWLRWQAGEADPAAALSPLYLREP